MAIDNAFSRCPDYYSLHWMSSPDENPDLIFGLFACLLAWRILSWLKEISDTSNRVLSSYHLSHKRKNLLLFAKSSFRGMNYLRLINLCSLAISKSTKKWTSYSRNDLQNESSLQLEWRIYQLQRSRNLLIRTKFVESYRWSVEKRLKKGHHRFLAAQDKQRSARKFSFSPESHLHYQFHISCVYLVAHPRVIL